MKKIGLMVVAVSLSLSVAAFAQQNQPKAERPAKTSAAEEKGKVRDRARADQAQSPEAIAKQLASLKQEHQAAINELEEIKKLAAEEKATRTVGALDKLIARRNQEFQKRIEPLQQRLKKLEAPGKGGKKQGDEAPKASGEKTPRKAGGKKNNQ